MYIGRYYREGQFRTEWSEKGEEKKESGPLSKRVHFLDRDFHGSKSENDRLGNNARGLAERQGGQDRSTFYHLTGTFCLATWMLLANVDV